MYSSGKILKNDNKSPHGRGGFLLSPAFSGLPLRSFGRAMPSLKDAGGVAVEDATPRSLAVFGARQIGFCKNSGMGITFFAKNYIQTKKSVIKYCV